MDMRRIRRVLQKSSGIVGGIAIIFGGYAIVVGTTAHLVSWKIHRQQPPEPLFSWIQVTGIVLETIGLIGLSINASLTSYDVRQQQAQRKSTEIPVACQGCKHYHGQRYGKNFLVCGMYPKGWEGDSCPDYESKKPMASPQHKAPTIIDR
jgi:hypothetical protein